MLYSNDDKVYYEGLGFTPAKQWVVFPAPIWAKYLKLLLRGVTDTATKRFGIYRLDAWTKNYKIMFRSKMKGLTGYCLTVANGKYEKGTHLQLMDCI